MVVHADLTEHEAVDTHEIMSDDPSSVCVLGSQEPVAGVAKDDASGDRQPKKRETRAVATL